MSALSIQVPFPVFQDRDGQPLDNGYVWLGTSSLNPQTNPVVAYYDSALTIVATQPLRTLNGFISRAGSPAQVYVDAVNFSILVQDRQGTTVFSVPEGTGISPNASGVVYDPAGTGAVATTVQAKLRESVSVKDFGAIGDGVANDAAAFIAAALYLNSIGGGTLILDPGKTYYINTNTSGSIIMDLVGMTGFTLEGNGATIRTGTLNYVKRILNISGCSNTTIRNVNFVSQYASLSSADGIIWTDIKGGSKNTSFENCTFTYGLYGINCTGTGETLRVRGISAINCTFTGVYYPQRFETNGDDYFARGIVTRNCGRSYFPANVINHDVWMDSQQGGPFSDVLLKCYTSADTTNYYMVAVYPNLENISLHYKTIGRWPGSGDCTNSEEGTIAVDIQLLPSSTTPGIVKNIQIDADIVNSASDKFSMDFVIRKYNSAGQPDPTGRNHLVKNVRLSGNIENAEALLANAGLGTTNPAVWLCATPNGGAGAANWAGENVSQVILRDLRINGTNTTEAHVIVNEQVCTGVGQNYVLENVTTAGKLTRANASLGNTAITASKSADKSRVSADVLTYNGYVSGSIGGASAGATATGDYSIANGRVTYKGHILITDPLGLATGNIRVSLPTYTDASGLSLGSFFGYSANTGIILAGACFANPSDNLMLFAAQGLASQLNNASYTWLANDYLYFQIEYQML